MPVLAAAARRIPLRQALRPRPRPGSHAARYDELPGRKLFQLVVLHLQCRHGSERRDDDRLERGVCHLVALESAALRQRGLRLECVAGLAVAVVGDSGGDQRCLSRALLRRCVAGYAPEVEHNWEFLWGGAHFARFCIFSGGRGPNLVSRMALLCRSGASVRDGTDIFSHHFHGHQHSETAASCCMYRNVLPEHGYRARSGTQHI
mmetsp:Transcript_19324/g.62889  ORF Transcript_19324/g.62889 Transcript_19324/m.62889 type:complete len:205 (-) Transcript_19324:54-668(-)